MRAKRLVRAVEVFRTEGTRAFVRKSLRQSWRLVKKTHNGCQETIKAKVFSSRFPEFRNQRLSIQELHAKTIEVQSKPRHVTIESTTYCNLKCVMCEHSIEGMVADKRHFPEHLVPRLLPVLPTANRFQLHSLGEPLMSPAFWMLLDEITAVHTGMPEITFNSNGLLLNEKNIARLLATKVREINISFDAATPETYAKIRGGDFEKVLSNVAALVKARAASRRSDFKIMINMTMMRANIEELPEFIRLAKRLGVDEVGFWRLNDGDNYERPDWIVTKGDWRFAYNEESPKHYPNLFNAKVREAVRVARELDMRLMEDKEWMIEGEGQREDRVYSPVANAADPVTRTVSPVANTVAVAAPPPVDEQAPEQLVQLSVDTLRLDGPSGIPAPKSSSIGKCEAPWKWLVVNNRGDCLPCCYLQGTIGNLEKQTIDEIWNGQPIQEIRSSIAKGEVHKLCQGASCQFVRGGAV